MTDIAGHNAGALRRLVAGLLDGAVALAASFIPGVGGVVALAYMLLRDSVFYRLIRKEIFRNRSVGKLLVGIRVVTDGEGPVDFRTSMKRNMSLVVGALFGVLVSPLTGVVDLGFGQALLAGPAGAVVVITGLLPLAGEAYLLFRDSEGRRWGDHFAKTRVIRG